MKEFNKLQETAKSVERLAVAGMPYSACVELGNLAHDLLQAESISDAKGAALLKSASRDRCDRRRRNDAAPF